MLVGVGDSFLDKHMNVRIDVRTFVRSNSHFTGLFPAGGCFLFFTESLILAQDERWRRA